MPSKRAAVDDDAGAPEQEGQSAEVRESEETELGDTGPPVEGAAEEPRSDERPESGPIGTPGEELDTGARGRGESVEGATADSATSGGDADMADAAGRTAPAAKGAVARVLQPAVLLPLLLVVLLAGSTAYLGYRLYAVNGLMEARASAAEAGERYALDLTTYDYRDLQNNFAAVTNNSTDEFGKQYEEVSNSLTEMIKQYQATSEGTVVQQGVAEATENRAVLTMFVDQSITNTNTPEPRVDRNRMEMTLVRQDDRWLVQDLKLL